jgi:hypothetical protein
MQRRKTGMAAESRTFANVAHISQATKRCSSAQRCDLLALSDPVLPIGGAMRRIR